MKGETNMSIKIPKIFGELTEEELNLIQSDFNRLNDNFIKFQQRQSIKQIRKNTSPIIKSSRYHLNGTSLS